MTNTHRSLLRACEEMCVIPDGPPLYFIEIYLTLLYNTNMSKRTRFIVGESAPNAIEAEQGLIIPNCFGNMALRGFMPDPLDETSEVSLDESVEPPVLYLNNALTTTLFGYTNQQTGVFNEFGHELPLAEHMVSGHYSGPGSELEIH